MFSPSKIVVYYFRVKFSETGGDNQSHTENKYNSGCLMSMQGISCFFLCWILSSLSSSSSSDDSTDSSSSSDSDEFSFSAVVSNPFLLCFLQLLFFDVLDSASLIWSCSRNLFCETSLEWEFNLGRLTYLYFYQGAPWFYLEKLQNFLFKVFQLHLLN